MLNFKHLQQTDKEVYDSVIAEYDRQQNGIELIASENRPSEAVLEAQASYHTLKYAEGYPRKKILCWMREHRCNRRFSKRKSL